MKIYGFLLIGGKQEENIAFIACLLCLMERSNNSDFDTFLQGGNLR